MKRLLVAVSSLVVASGCVVAGPGPAMPAPPPPAPAPEAGSPRPINSGEAERIALRVAAQHGYTQPQIKKVRHDEGQGGRWKVEIRGLANGREGKLDVRLANNGQVLDVKDHQKGEHHGVDDDDEKKDRDKQDKHREDDDD